LRPVLLLDNSKFVEEEHFLVLFLNLQTLPNGLVAGQVLELDFGSVHLLLGLAQLLLQLAVLSRQSLNLRVIKLKYLELAPKPLALKFLDMRHQLCYFLPMTFLRSHYFSLVVASRRFNLALQVLQLFAYQARLLVAIQLGQILVSLPLK
jgi:hypothetical protein